MIYAVTGVGNLALRDHPRRHRVQSGHPLGRGLGGDHGPHRAVCRGGLGIVHVTGEATWAGRCPRPWGLTGLLGVAFKSYIDNWGHAGGVIIRRLPPRLLSSMVPPAVPSALGLGAGSDLRPGDRRLRPGPGCRRSARGPATRRELAARLDRRALRQCEQGDSRGGTPGRCAVDPRGHPGLPERCRYPRPGPRPAPTGRRHPWLSPPCRGS